VYSLGSTIFAILAGRNPHQNSVGEKLRIEQILMRVNDPDFAVELPRDREMPQELFLLLRAMMAKDPLRRLSSAAQALEGFRRIEATLAMSSKEFPLPVSVSMPSMNEIVAEGLRSDSGGVARATRTIDPAKQQRHLPTLDPLPLAEGPMSALPLSLPDSFDPNSTVGIASAKTNRPAALPTQEPPSRLGGMDRQRWIFAAACVAAIAIGSVVAVALSGSKGPSPTTTLGPSDSEPISLPGLNPPRNVQLVSRGPTALEVTWIASNDPGIQYEVEVLRGNETIQVLKANGANVTVDNLELNRWLPCIVVTAISTSQGRTASANSICAEVPADADNSTPVELTSTSSATVGAA
jgi:hypothetical protein